MIEAIMMMGRLKANLEEEILVQKNKPAEICDQVAVESPYMYFHREMAEMLERLASKL